MTHRTERLGSLMRTELAKIVLREVETPGALLTVSNVSVSSKLESARVKVEVLPSEKAAEVMKILAREGYGLRRLLMKKIRIRTMPRLIFELDHGSENAAKVEKALMGDREYEG